MTLHAHYSVFGFNRLMTDSPEEAQMLSIAILAIVATVFTVIGAGGLYLLQRFLRWRKSRKNFTSQPTATESESSATEIASATVPQSASRNTDQETTSVGEMLAPPTGLVDSLPPK
ncbi:hypothetical protein [Tuwongella immobilis]|nr:hypothetical protein [Tuwongella immobilis]